MQLIAILQSLGSGDAGPRLPVRERAHETRLLITTSSVSASLREADQLAASGNFGSEPGADIIAMSRLLREATRSVSRADICPTKTCAISGRHVLTRSGMGTAALCV